MVNVPYTLCFAIISLTTVHTKITHKCIKSKYIGEGISCLEDSSQAEEVDGTFHGPTARCIDSTVGHQEINEINGRCYKIKCQDFNALDNVWNSVDIFIGGKLKINCNRYEINRIKKIDKRGFVGQITCPDVDIICGSTKEPFKCTNGDFSNTQNKCICYAGWYGNDCSSQSPKHFIQQIDSSTYSRSTSSTVSSSQSSSD